MGGGDTKSGKAHHELHRSHEAHLVVVVDAVADPHDVLEIEIEIGGGGGGCSAAVTAGVSKDAQEDKEGKRLRT